MKKPVIILVLLLLLTISSCKPEFEPISYGHDACTNCKMTIMDKRYAAELLTKKGKAYKFDDISCLKKYARQENLAESDYTVFVANYTDPDNKFLDAREVVYLHSEIFKSPMNGNYAAFPTAENSRPLKDSLHTDLLKWENLN